MRPTTCNDTPRVGGRSDRGGRKVTLILGNQEGGEKEKSRFIFRSSEIETAIKDGRSSPRLLAG